MTTSYFAGLAEITNPEHQIGETIRIAGAQTVFSGFIVPRFDRMREALPQFRFALMQRRSDEATQMARIGRADVAVVRETANLEGLEPRQQKLSRLLLPPPLQKNGNRRSASGTNRGGFALAAFLWAFLLSLAPLTRRGALGKWRTGCVLPAIAAQVRSFSMGYRPSNAASLLTARERALVLDLISRMPLERTALEAMLAAGNKGDFEQESLKPPNCSCWPFYDDPLLPEASTSK